MELINGRTAEEIKRGLRWIANDCDEYGEDCSECECVKECHTMVEDDVAKDALALIEWLEAQVPRWISAEERLPKPFVSVLVQMPGEEPHPTVREGYISNEGVWVAGYFKRELDEVTHWMPLPEKTKEGAHE